ncbi:MAG: hypothetical protein HC830_03300 [Bacteroidetes bacterium]|nr:hypothetical protein [Bacteroidota bacterium]
MIFGYFASCERDAFQEGRKGSFSFSTDTVAFDTIFTNLGTATYKLIVRNPNNFKIEFDSVYLALKAANTFILNIDGQSANVVKKLSLDARDSLYIFIQAYVPETSENAPFVKEDSLVFVSGLNRADIKLIAVAQNVVSFRNSSIKSQVWSKDKPYLIFGTLTVDSASNLKIGEGTRVYFHRNARMIINGALEVNGTYLSPVIFKGDRLEKDYDTIPGQWDGIYLAGADYPHLIRNAIIRNGTNGIHVGSPNNNKEVNVKIENTVSINMGYSSLIAYQAEIIAYNCVFANSSYSACTILNGGKYEFLHCTIANYGAKYVDRNFDSRTLVMQNFFSYVNNEGESILKSNDLEKAEFRNTIIYGGNNDEIKLSFKDTHLHYYLFDHCLLKLSTTTSSDPDIVNSLISKSPEFKNPDTENFRLDTISPAKDGGKFDFSLPLPVDLDNNSRLNDLAPDMGAYERIEK